MSTNHRKRGFTLLEMILALGVFTLIVSTLFFTMQSVFRLCTEVAETRQWSLKNSSLHEFLQTLFRTLPPNAELKYTVDENGSSPLPVFELSKIAYIYPGEHSTNHFYLFLKKQSDERFDLMMARDMNTPFPLFRKIESLKWQFYNAQNQSWETNWQNPTALPSLAELTYKTMDSPVSLTMTFWIPHATQLAR